MKLAPLILALGSAPQPSTLPADPFLVRDTVSTVTVGAYTIAIDRDGNPLAIGVHGDVEWWTYTVDYATRRH